MATHRDTLKIESLNSWKEISLYLDRGVRTVQRWERDLGLPVHRVGRGPRSPVHAFPAELQAWMLRLGSSRAAAEQQDGHRPLLMHPDGSVATARVLVKRSSVLVKQMVDSLWAQRKRAEELWQEVEQFRDRMHQQLGTLNGSRRGVLKRTPREKPPIHDPRTRPAEVGKPKSARRKMRAQQNKIAQG